MLLVHQAGLQGADARTPADTNHMAAKHGRLDSASTRPRIQLTARPRHPRTKAGDTRTARPRESHLSFPFEQGKTTKQRTRRGNMRAFGIISSTVSRSSGIRERLRSRESVRHALTESCTAGQRMSLAHSQQDSPAVRCLALNHILSPLRPMARPPTTGRRLAARLHADQSSFTSQRDERDAAQVLGLELIPLSVNSHSVW